MLPPIPQECICVTCHNKYPVTEFLKATRPGYFRTCLGCRAADKERHAKQPGSLATMNRRYEELKAQLPTRTYEDALQAH